MVVRHGDAGGMGMIRLSLAAMLSLVAMLMLSGTASAQNALETQAPVPIGGTDTRALPTPDTLPPMFGANLFTGPNFTMQTTPGTSPQATGSGTSTGTLGKGAGIPAQAVQLAAQGNDVSTLLGQVSQQNIPATTVQPPAGMAAFDPAHVMAPGDAVQIHIYGATTLDQEATVDSNGDIFLPSIGPVHIAGTLAGNLQAVVSKAIASSYQSNAQVYVTLATAVPVDVFVTGAVIAPGQYSKPSTASIISFLQSAGGIDPKRGSYRDVEILRNGRVIATADLYEFLLSGRLPPVRLQERDTVVVKEQGSTIAAEGDVRGVFRYEMRHPETGAQLIALARPYPDATRVTLQGIRGGRPASFSYSLAEFRRVTIDNGDVATFNADTPTNVMTIKLDGRIDGPTSLVVARQSTLFDVLPYVPIDPYFSDDSAIYIRRVSVAQAQKKSIDDAIQRLKAEVVTAPTITAEQAQMQQQQATVIFQYAQQLSDVKPEGRLVIEHNGRPENVRLEDGDVIVVPSKTDLVLVGGEVRLPQAVVWVSGAPLKHYIKTAGGFTNRADDDRILVIRPSGETLVGDNPPISPGDRIVVLPSGSNWVFPFVKDITQIIYQIAVTAGVATNLK